MVIELLAGKMRLDRISPEAARWWEENAADIPEMV